MKRNIAVILAGGVGSRLGMSTPKQFFKVAGKMVVEHTVDVFERNQHIDEIAIVANPMLISDFENIVLRNKRHKVKKILTLRLVALCHTGIRQPGRQPYFPRRGTPACKPAYSK